MPRPRKYPQQTPKKGKKTWAPAQALEVKKVPGFRLRWTDKDPKVTQRKMAEGWVEVHPDQGIRAEHEHPGDVPSGKPVTSVTEYRELHLMALPEDVAKAREAYFTDRTNAQSAGLVRNLKKDVAEGGDAEVYGKITIIE